MSDSPQTQTQTEPTSAGAMLRAARERQGMHIAALAAAIKVAPRKLDALENDRWEELPDATFARALAQTVCRTLKVDPRPVLAKLPQADAASLEHAGGSLNTPFRERASRDEPGLAGAAIRPMIGAAVLLMIAAVALYLMPSGWWGDADDVVTTPGTSIIVTPIEPTPVSPDEGNPAEGEGEPASGIGVEPGAPSAGADGEADSGAPTASASAVEIRPAASGAGDAPRLAATDDAAAVPLASDTAAGLQTPSVAWPSVAPAAAQPTTAVPSGMLQLATTAESWVEVRDTDNRVLLARLLGAGERVGLDGAAPFRVTIGNAGATEIQFRGRSVDLGPLTRDNVARLTLR
jgi:cytoskeleton protein RodZ